MVQRGSKEIRAKSWDPVFNVGRTLADRYGISGIAGESPLWSFVAGVPWGTAQVSFEADNKPARQVLKQLMVAEEKANSESSATHPYYDHWAVRCDGTGSPWCFIEVESRYSARCP